MEHILSISHIIPYEVPISYHLNMIYPCMLARNPAMVLAAIIILTSWCDLLLVCWCLGFRISELLGYSVSRRIQCIESHMKA